MTDDSNLQQVATEGSKNHVDNLFSLYSPYNASAC